jgi:cystathionine beta-lyase family protein involved in aluminum resistance
MARAGMNGADHALACALFACLRPGDHVLFLTGPPASSTQKVIAGHPGCLEEWGIACTAVNMFEGQSVSTDRLEACMHEHKPAAVVIQRNTCPRTGTQCEVHAGGMFLTVAAVAMVSEAARRHARGGKPATVIVDNRGAEFVEGQEPGAVGADLVTGSLLGAVGGGIVPSGGYVCGEQALVEQACARFCAPGAFSSGNCCASLLPCTALRCAVFVATLL